MQWVWESAAKAVVGNIKQINTNASRKLSILFFKAFPPFCFVTEDGEWIEKGEMGWWCSVSNEKSEETWKQQFIDYVFSGAQGSTELIDKIIAMGEQFAEQKEAGYTFKERINQLITPDNMITTVSAAFLLVCGIALFIFKRWQKRSNIALHKDVTYLREKYDEEALENKKLKEEVIAQSNEIKELKELIMGLCERSDLRKTDMKHVSHTAAAVAKMVKDVFLNSKTIDASGKALLVHNYMEAIGGEESEKDEQSS